MTKYVLITPVRNEESNIQRTIESLLAQTLRPVKWIIVDDASTDCTAEIVHSYLSGYPFISLVKRETLGERNFGSKVAAFNVGLKCLIDTEYSFIGNLDGDIILAPDYYENILAEFGKDPKLGIAGGNVHTKIGERFVSYDHTDDSVAGAIQLFRKECFEQIGGYTPLEHGGIDAAAEILARMHGWAVRKVPHNIVYEHRRTGSARKLGFVTRYKEEGEKFHSLGYSTLFYCFRCAYRLKNRPFFIGSMLSLIGFMSAKLRGSLPSLPPQAVSYLRSEQMEKLKQLLWGNSKCKKVAAAS